MVARRPRGGTVGVVIPLDEARAHVLAEKQAGRLTKPAMVITLTSLIGNWQREIARFAPDLRVVALDPGVRRIMAAGELVGAESGFPPVALGEARRIAAVEERDDADDEPAARHA